MSTKSTISRREFLRLAGISAAGVALTACAPKIVPTPEPATAIPPIASANPEGEIIIWNRSGDLFQVLDATIESFNKKYPKIIVKHEAVDINAKLATTLTTGVDVPDGTFVEDVNIPSLAEFFTDITDWIKPYTKDIVPLKLRVDTYNGKAIAIPYDLCPGLLYYREDILEDAGIVPTSIGTYDDMLEAAKVIQEKLGAERKPIHIERANWAIPLQLEMFANQQGTSLMGENGELQFDSEPYLKAVKWINKALQSGVGNLQEYLSPGDIQAIDTDQIAFYPWAIWFVYGPENLFKESKGKWRAMSLPAWNAGGNRGANMGGSSFAIPKQSKNPELAWLFYEHLMFSQEGYKAVYGSNDVYPGGLNSSLSGYLPAHKEQLFENPEGLGGQNLWDVAVSTVKDIPENYHYAPWYGQASEIIASNMQKMQDGLLTPEEAVSQTASEITSRVIDR